MKGLLQTLQEQKKIHPPKWLPDNVMYLTYMGSVAYGVSTDMSDADIYGFCIPPKDDVFPHLRGEIPGFGYQKNRFDQWQEHHVEGRKRTYDFTVYSIVRYFHLAMENNPNMVDSLYTPTNLILKNTQVGQMVRENRDLFLHKGSWHKFKGYAYAQVVKMGKQNHKEGSERYKLVQKYGYDVKAAYHVVRLVDEIDQILTLKTLNLQRAKEQLKAIRNGEWTLENVKTFFMHAESSLEEAYHASTLPHTPNETAIKELLLNCLEHHYGSLSCNEIRMPGKERYYLQRILDYAEEALS